MGYDSRADQSQQAGGGGGKYAEEVKAVEKDAGEVESGSATTKSSDLVFGSSTKSTTKINESDE